MIAPRKEKNDETIPPQSLCGVQGQGGTGRREGRSERWLSASTLIQIRSRSGNHNCSSTLRKGSQPGAERGTDSEAVLLKDLHAKIGQQALEIDFLAGALGRLSGSSAKR